MSCVEALCYPDSKISSWPTALMSLDTLPLYPWTWPPVLVAVVILQLVALSVAALAIGWVGGEVEEIEDWLLMFCRYLCFLKPAQQTGPNGIKRDMAGNTRRGEARLMITATGVYPQSALSAHPDPPECDYHRLNPQGESTLYLDYPWAWVSGWGSGIDIGIEHEGLNSLGTSQIPIQKESKYVWFAVCFAFTFFFGSEVCNVW